MREKKFWRELIRVVAKNDHTIIVVIPSWRPEEGVDFSIGEIGEETWEALQVGGRYFAMVNSDAEYMVDLEIRDIETKNITPVSQMSDDYIRQNAKSLPVDDLVKELIRLRDAIWEHRQQTGDNLCWINDLKLWQAVDPLACYRHDMVPGREEFLGNCARYHESRVKGLPYDEAPQKTSAVTKDGKRIDQ